MAGSGTVTVNIIGKSDKLNSELTSVTSKMSAFGDKLTATGKKMTVGLTAPIVAGMAFSAKAASDFGESLNKVNEVFGAQGKEIEIWAAGAAKNLGLSKSAALEAAGGFGNMFTQLGITTTAAAGMSQGVIGLAADFASFHNADISEVINAQSAAFRGEYDSLQRFLPLINAAAVEEKALNMVAGDLAITAAIGTEEWKAQKIALTAAKESITAQDKALAVNALMHEGAGKAAGDFSRTQDGLANSTRIAKAEAENAAISFGQALQPVTEKIALAVGWLAEKFAGLSSGQQTTILVVAGLLAVLGPLITLIGTLATVMAFLAANPIVLVIAAIAALALGLYMAYQKCETFRNIVDAVFHWIMDHWPLIITVVLGPLGLAIAVLVKNFDSIKDAVAAVWHFIKPILEKIGAAISKVAGPLGSVVGAVGKVGGAIGSLNPFSHAGGIVPGALGTNVPIMAQAGERIIARGASGSSEGPIFIQLSIDGRAFGEITAKSLLDLQTRSGPIGIQSV